MKNNFISREGGTGEALKHLLHLILGRGTYFNCKNSWIYSVTHMDSYRSKLVFWPLFKGLETCPSRFVMGSTVHFIFWNNVQTKWIFEFWPYFQKIPMWKHKKLENWRSNFPNFIPDIKMYAPCNNKNVFEIS